MDLFVEILLDKCKSSIFQEISSKFNVLKVDLLKLTSSKAEVLLSYLIWFGTFCSCYLYNSHSGFSDVTPWVCVGETVVCPNVELYHDWHRIPQWVHHTSFSSSDAPAHQCFFSWIVCIDVHGQQGLIREIEDLHVMSVIPRYMLVEKNVGEESHDQILIFPLTSV